MLGELDVGLVRVDDPVCASLQSCLELHQCQRHSPADTVVLQSLVSYQWDEFCRLCHQSVGDFLVELDQVANVDVAVVFFEQRIFT